MIHGYLSGLKQPNQQILIPKERRIGGHAIGIIKVDVVCPMLPGDVSNATTFNFPVLYKVVEKSHPEQFSVGDRTALDNVIRAGEELVMQGVRAITTSCGYFGIYQKEVAEALNVPVFLSSLLQIPIISRALGPKRKVGLILAYSPYLSASLLSACGVDDPSTIVVAGAEELPEFKNIPQTTGQYNSHKIEQELVGLIRRFVSNNPDIGALVLECSNMPPYAWSIQNAVGIPVFDFITLINWVYGAVVRYPFAGFI